MVKQDRHSADEAKFQKLVKEEDMCALDQLRDELNESGWIPSIIYPVWDINHILSETSELGLVLKALFGYNGNPSLTEVIAYVTFLTLLLVNYVRFQRSNSTLLSAKASSEHL